MDTQAQELRWGATDPSGSAHCCYMELMPRESRSFHFSKDATTGNHIVIPPLLPMSLTLTTYSTYRL